MIKQLIGIDPGTNTGFAVKAFEGVSERITDARSLPLHSAFSALQDVDKASTLVVFEDARLRDWYGAAEQQLYRKYIGNMPMTQQERHAYKGLLLGAGSVKRDSAIWEDFLTDGGFMFVAMKPAAKKTKMKADFFKRVTGFTGRTNEHARDAAFLILSLSRVWANEQGRRLLRERAQ